MKRSMVRLSAIFAFTTGLSVLVAPAASWASKAKPTMPMSPHMGPVTFKNDHQTAPAVTAKLMPAASTACGHKVTGSGSVMMIPVHVGKMMGIHVDLVVQLHNAGMMRKYGISGKITGKPPVAWSGMAGSAVTNMHGGLRVQMRLMPMVREGRYRVQITLHDMSCGGMMSKPLAYRTSATTIRLK